MGVCFIDEFIVEANSLCGESFLQVCDQGKITEG